jgi:hypothetical protein
MKLVLPTIAVLFILAGCGGTGGGGAYYSEGETTTSAAASEGTSAATEETTTSNNVTATVRLTPMNGSATTGTATFTDVAQGVVRVKLSMLGLPDTNATTYLTHIHPGTCADEQSGDEEEQDSDHEHEHSDHEDTNEEIEYPLPPISADPQGEGFTTAVLDSVTVQELFSGEPKYINVHAEGSGNPPPLACGQLSMNIKSSAPSLPHS